MRLYDRHAATPKGLPEIARTMRSKTFDLGGRKRKLVQTIGPIHWHDGQAWQDIDLQPVLQADGMWRVDQAAYKLIVDPATAMLRHESRETGLKARVGLKAIGGQPVTLPVPTVEDGRIFWSQVVPGVDIELILRPAGAEWFKSIRSAAAPHDFTWTVEREVGFPAGRIKLATEGRDNAGDRLRMSHQQTVERLEAGWVKFEQTETFERQVSRIVDKRTRRREWKDDVIYPVRIDQDISEPIAATADDGFEYAGIWFQNNYDIQMAIFGASVLPAGFRFQTVNVPQGVTIDLATLKLYLTSSYGTPAGLWYGDDVDDAPAFSNSNLPSGITKTSAQEAASGSGTGVKNQDVTSIVQELVNRVGWTANNDMRFAGFMNNASGNHSWRWEDYARPTANQAVLEIDYTEGGSEITGTGVLTSATTTILSQGISGSSGTALLLAQTGDLFGLAEASWNATGFLIASTADLSGAGASLWLMDVLLAAQAAQVFGQGTTETLGTGLLIAVASVVLGQATSAQDAIGLLTSGSASLAGVGVSSSSGTGLLTAEAAELFAQAVNSWNAIGALVAGAADLIALGEISWLAIGLLQSGDADLTGLGVSGSSGTGLLQAEDAVVIGRLDYYDRIIEASMVYTDRAPSATDFYIDRVPSATSSYTDKAA